MPVDVVVVVVASSPSGTEEEEEEEEARSCVAGSESGSGRERGRQADLGILLLVHSKAAALLAHE